MRTLALLLLLLPTLALADITGPARVLDGDSLIVDGHEIRLFGVDAFEHDQSCRRDGRDWPCGKAATDTLRQLVAGATCEATGQSYDRIVAICRAGGVDLAEALVARGLALAYRRYSKSYVDEERSARLGRRGAWAGSFTAPWRWRRRAGR